MKKNKKKSGCALFGLLIVAVGVLLLALNLGWLSSELKQIVFSWPMIFIACAILSLTPLSMRSHWQTAFWTMLGVFFLLPRIATVYPDALPGIDENFASNYWPVLLILFGIGVVLYISFGKNRFFWRVWRNFSDDDDFPWNSENIEGTDGKYYRDVMFNRHDDIFLEPVFRKGSIDVLFGGVKLDLRKTTLPEGNTYLNIDILFGGVEITVPEDWVVVSKSDVWGGGVVNKRSEIVKDDQSRKLIIKSDVLFGGVEIR